MAKLVYWVAVQNEDNACYNIVAKTKKDCLQQIASTDAWWGPSGYEAPIKKEVQYTDAFDLLDKVTGDSCYRS